MHRQMQLSMRKPGLTASVLDKRSAQAVRYPVEAFVLSSRPKLLSQTKGRWDVSCCLKSLIASDRTKLSALPVLLSCLLHALARTPPYACYSTFANTLTCLVFCLPCLYACLMLAACVCVCAALACAFHVCVAHSSGIYTSDRSGSLSNFLSIRYTTPTACVHAVHQLVRRRCSSSTGGL